MAPRNIRQGRAGLEARQARPDRPAQPDQPRRAARRKRRQAIAARRPAVIALEQSNEIKVLQGITSPFFVIPAKAQGCPGKSDISQSELVLNIERGLQGGWGLV